ncbi:MAG: hypothetical protein ACK5NX_03305, partial [Armatimonadota bacterium]
MLTPPSFLKHRESTGVVQNDLKPGDFSVMSKSRGRWLVADRNSRGDRAKKKPASGTLRAVKEEHQCSGTGSHTGHRYGNMLT